MVRRRTASLDDVERPHHSYSSHERARRRYLEQAMKFRRLFKAMSELTSLPGTGDQELRRRFLEEQLLLIF
jgi:hypothetical protein